MNGHLWTWSRSPTTHWDSSSTAVPSIRKRTGRSRSSGPRINVRPWRLALFVGKARVWSCFWVASIWLGLSQKWIKNIKMDGLVKSSSAKIPSRNGWFGGSPYISGNIHWIYGTTRGFCCASWVLETLWSLLLGTQCQLRGWISNVDADNWYIYI